MLKVIKLNESVIRVIHGDLYEELDIEWDKYDLKELKTMLEILLDSHQNDLKSLRRKGKNIKIYKGSNHIDIVEDGVGSLGILKVLDYHLIAPDLDD